MNYEQVEKIRSYLLENGQQELVGHLDGMVGEWRKAQAILEEQLPVVDPIEEGETPEPSAEITGNEQALPEDDEDHTTAQDFQEQTASDSESEK